MPSQSYAIWFSQRVGSTLLSQALEDTGIAGRPREWFTDNDNVGILAKHGVATPSELRELLWREATSTNGVIGVKYGMVAAQHEQLTALFRELLPTGRADADDRHAWEAIFPRCQHVFMTRRNKVRLAVSWWRAIKSGEWHRASGAPAPTLDVVDKYDYDAIDYLRLEVDTRESLIHDLLARWSVAVHTIVYEDLVAHYDATIRGVLDFLQIPDRENARIPAPAFAQLADDLSDAWCERYERERIARAQR
jgi:LPS sulfotransferase NodH